MKEYDVVIVGGGIAGSVAARYLAKNRKSVLFIESAKLPRNKPCSGIQFKYFQRFLGKKIPRNKLCRNEIKSIFFELPNQKTFKVPCKMLNFTRDVFDQWLNEVAIDEGAEFLEGTRCMGFTELNNGYEVHLRSKNETKINVRTRYLLGADGLFSTIRKQLRPQDFNQKSPAKSMNFYLECKDDCNLNPNTLYQFWNLNYSNLMFAWVYKKNDLWVVGTGHTEKIMKHCEDLLSHVKEKFDLEGKIIKKEGFATKFDLSRPEHTFLGKENLLLLGDAAGLVDLYRGFGMDVAALSARFAVKSILKSEKKGKRALGYYEKKMKRIVKKIDKNTSRSVNTIKDNEEYLKYFKRHMLRTGPKILFGLLLNRLLPINRTILLPP